MNPLYDELFGRHRGADSPFMILSDETVISHGRFLERASQIAHALSAEGLNPGDRVALQVHKSPDALAVYAACAQAGFVFLPLNAAYTPLEVSYFLENSDAKVLICAGEKGDMLTHICTSHSTRLHTLNSDGTGTIIDASKDKPTTFETVPRTGDDLAAFLYTSGTTGRSKAAMLTQENLLSNAKTLATHWRFTADDVLLHALPIFHSHGLFVACNVSLLAGGAMIFLPKFDVDQVIAALPKATCMMGVPTFYTRLLDDPRFTRNLTQHMRLFISGSAPLLAETHISFEERTEHRILERYGMTETNMNTSNPYDGERRAGTVGFPLPDVEIKITNPETGAPLPRKQIGQIEVRGPNVFKGYWKMPEKTAEELRGDGFFITGDLGKMDADGYVHIVGRNKDLIISGGFNIYPKELELVLDAQPGVLESAVIGVPHADFGETVLGLIVPEKGASPDLEAIMAAACEALARFKRPKQLLLIEELPRNAMGKVQKNVLRESYKDTFAAR